MTASVPGLYDHSERMRTYFKDSKPLTSNSGSSIMKLSAQGGKVSKQYTIVEDSEPRNKVVTKFGRMKPKEFISKNAMKSPYEFVADYLAILEDNKTSKELKTMFKWSD